MPATEAEILASYPQVSAPTELSGYTSNLTESQKSILAELKIKLTELNYKARTDDGTLLRFLRARKFDLELALDMFIKCEKWREEFGTNTILEDFKYTEKPLVAQMYPQYYHKTDKEGRPVYYEELGKINFTKMLKFTTQERMLKNLVWEYEAFTQYRLPPCSREVGYLVETSCTILDLSGISITAAYSVSGYVKEASYIGQNYYPERMGKFYIINAPFGFSTAFNLFKPFLDPVTVSKIFVLGYSYKSELKAQIPPQNLPKKFGGLSEANDQLLYLNDDGPWRDEKFAGPEGTAPKAFEI